MLRDHKNASFSQPKLLKGKKRERKKKWKIFWMKKKRLDIPVNVISDDDDDDDDDDDNVFT